MRRGKKYKQLVELKQQFFESLTAMLTVHSDTINTQFTCPLKVTMLYSVFRQRTCAA